MKSQKMEGVCAKRLSWHAVWSFGSSKKDIFANNNSGYLSHQPTTQVCIVTRMWPGQPGIEGNSYLSCISRGIVCHIHSSASRRRYLQPIHLCHRSTRKKKTEQNQPCLFLPIKIHICENRWSFGIKIPQSRIPATWERIVFTSRSRLIFLVQHFVHDLPPDLRICSRFSRLFWFVVSWYCSFFSRLEISEVASPLSRVRRLLTVLMGTLTNLEQGDKLVSVSWKMDPMRNFPDFLTVSESQNWKQGEEKWKNYETKRQDRRKNKKNAHIFPTPSYTFVSEGNSDSSFDVSCSMRISRCLAVIWALVILICCCEAIARVSISWRSYIGWNY